jgi:hypothetical protein
MVISIHRLLRDLHEAPHLAHVCWVGSLLLYSRFHAIHKDSFVYFFLSFLVFFPYLDFSFIYSLIFCFYVVFGFPSGFPVSFFINFIAYCRIYLGHCTWRTYVGLAHYSSTLGFLPTIKIHLSSFLFFFFLFGFLPLLGFFFDFSYFYAFRFSFWFSGYFFL